MIKKYKKGEMRKPETIIVKNGYEYILVESMDRTVCRMPPPRMFSMTGMALKAVRKVKKSKSNKI
jgi:hypothetical protein